VTGPPLIAAGRDADVFALGPRLVLRRYRAGGDVTAEVEIMRHLHRHGYPVPRVHHAAGADLVLERITGPTMAAAGLSGSIGVRDAAGVLADLLHRLHQVPTRTAAVAGHRLLHLDLHPENVLLAPAGPVVIDWRNATEGPPDLDLAMSALILAQVALDDGDERAALGRALVADFLALAGGRPERALARAAEMRAANPTQSPAERARIAPAVALVETLAHDLALTGRGADSRGADGRSADGQGADG
jgi:aminoglycoside phosphotransferase (APT) family kinase protein